MERYLTRRHKRSPFTQNATLFQDLVIRCVRFAFKYMDPQIGRVFFSKAVALPFFRFRMLRHGYTSSPIYWREVKSKRPEKSFHGLWIIANELEKPDIAIYYCHGGGFSMGSAYFYLEFLIAWISMLQDGGYKNPAIFALEYTLVPDAVYPTQLQQMMHGYEWLYSRVQDTTRICLSGDSAGATLCLSHLLHIHKTATYESGRPAFALLISPWTHMASPLNRDTTSDYLNADTLQLYGQQYAGLEQGKSKADDSNVSPGTLKDKGLWKTTAPRSGYAFVYGLEEVFAPNIEVVMETIRGAGVSCERIAEKAGIHAWPVVALFLGRNRIERLHGLQQMSSLLKDKIPARLTGCHFDDSLKDEKSSSFDLDSHRLSSYTEVGEDLPKQGRSLSFDIGLYADLDSEKARKS